MNLIDIIGIHPVNEQLDKASEQLECPVAVTITRPFVWARIALVAGSGCWFAGDGVYKSCDGGCDVDASIKDGDEIALFPIVTVG